MLDRLEGAKLRLTTGIALLGAVVLGIGPDTQSNFDSAKAVAVAIAAVAWLFAELQDSGRISEHDIELLGKIGEAFPIRTRDFLRDHDIGGSFPLEDVNPLHALGEFRGAEYEFVDARLEKEWKALREHARKFSYELALNTHPRGAQDVFLNPWPDNWLEDEDRIKVERKIESLNKDATSLVERLDAFERHGKRLLKL